MKRIMVTIVALLMLISWTFACAEATAVDKEYSGLWYLGTTGYGSDYVIASELIFNEDHTITFVSDEGSTGEWRVAEDGIAIELIIMSDLGTTGVTLNYEDGIYTAKYPGLYYTLTRETPITELNVKNREDEDLDEYVGVWLPYRLFVSGTEMPIHDVLSDDVKIQIQIEGQGDESEKTSPVLRIYQDNDDEDRLEEDTKAYFEKGEIRYGVFDYSGVKDKKNEDGKLKYFGTLNLREDDKIVMTMEYEGIVKIVMTLIKAD